MEEDELWTALGNITTSFSWRTASLKKKSQSSFSTSRSSGFMPAPYEDFKADLSPRNQASLTEQYEEAIASNRIVVFVRDNDQRKLVSYTIDYA